MQLLIERSQATSVATLTEQTNFKLWAMFELTPDEQGLIDNYTLRETILVEERKGNGEKRLFGELYLLF